MLGFGELRKTGFRKYVTNTVYYFATLFAGHVYQNDTLASWRRMCFSEGEGVVMGVNFPELTYILKA